MARRHVHALAVAALLAMVATVAYAGGETRSGFPYIDNCRKELSRASFDAQLTSSEVHTAVDDKEGSRYCFTLSKKECNDPDTRCCNTIIHKIRLSTSPDCPSRIFHHLEITNPNIDAFKTTKFVAVSRDALTGDMANVKFSWRHGALPELKTSEIDGTVICFVMRSPESGNTDCQTLQQISNPVAAAQGKFELALYDDKVDNYECCPTFAFDTAAKK